MVGRGHAQVYLTYRDSVMLYVMMLGIFAVTAILVWFVQMAIRRGMLRYHRAFTDQTRQDLGEMFLFLDPRQVWSASLLLCALSAVLSYALVGSLLISGLISTVMLFAPPYALTYARRLRIRKFERQLPDLLLALAGALRAGFGIQSALRQSAEHSVAPMSQELALMLREQRMGVSFEQALANLYQRVPVESLSLVVSALNIAAHSGGSLAETLERISVTLRMRLHLIGRIRALTSQGRMQAWIMASLPPVLALVLHGMDPDAMSALWNTPTGWAVLVVIAVLEITGIRLIQRIVQITV